MSFRHNSHSSYVLQFCSIKVHIYSLFVIYSAYDVRGLIGSVLLCVSADLSNFFELVGLLLDLQQPVVLYIPVRPVKY